MICPWHHSRAHDSTYENDQAADREDRLPPENLRGLRTHHTVRSELLDGADLHDWVSSDQHFGRLNKRVVVVAGDGEEAGQLLHSLREGALCDQRARMRSTLDRPGLPAVSQPSATGHGATTCGEQLAELVVDVDVA